MASPFERNFGLLIAVVIPGLITLSGVAVWSQTVAGWFLAADPAQPVIAGMVYVTIASVAAGMIVSAVRWAVIDSIHHWMGIERPDWNDAFLAERLDAYRYLIEIHYHYYQFYANGLVAIAWAYLAWRLSGALPGLGVWSDVGVLLLCAILFAGSRDALAKYHHRAGVLLGTVARKQDSVMTNGGHTSQEGGAGKTDRPAATPVPNKPEQQPALPKAGEQDKEKRER